MNKKITCLSVDFALSAGHRENHKKKRKRKTKNQTTDQEKQ